MSAAAFTAVASLDGESLDDRSISDEELARAHHALAYLKERIGNEGMRDLLAPDLKVPTRRVREWVEASGGRWRTGVADLIVPGPPAADFHRWYESAMNRRLGCIRSAMRTPP